MTKAEIKKFSQSSLNINRALGSTIVAETFPLTYVSTNAAPPSGQMREMAIWLNTTETILGVKWIQAVQGAYTADEYNGIGLYTYLAGVLTQVAVTANDGNIWKAAVGMSSKAFSTPYVAQPGLYIILTLYHSSAETTGPRMGCAVATLATSISLGDYTNSAQFIGSWATQIALPSPTMNMSSLATTQSNIWAALYK